MEGITWLILSIVTAIIGFFYGRHVEAFKTHKKKDDFLEEEELDNQKDLKLFKEEPKDYNYLKQELDRERETKRKQVEEYEKEITYLKGLIENNEAHFNSKIVIFI